MNRSKATQILQQVALKNGVSVSEVRKEIEAAADEAMKSPDPNVQAHWKAMSRNGKKPSAEEILIYLIQRLQAGDDTVDVLPGLHLLQ